MTLFTDHESENSTEEWSIPVPAEARVIRPSSGTGEHSLSSLPTMPNFRDDEYFIRHGTPPPPLGTARELHTGGPPRGKSEGGVYWQQACAASETVWATRSGNCPCANNLGDEGGYREKPHGPEMERKARTRWEALNARALPAVGEPFPPGQPDVSLFGDTLSSGMQVCF